MEFTRTVYYGPRLIYFLIHGNYVGFVFFCNGVTKGAYNDGKLSSFPWFDAEFV
jgi:hypothetical protein